MKAVAGGARILSITRKESSDAAGARIPGRGAFTDRPGEGRDGSIKYEGLRTFGSAAISARVIYPGPEPLELRLTPSALLPTISADGKTATFVDVDGDVFHVTTNKGAFVPGNFTYEGDDLSGEGYLQTIDISASNFGTMFKGAKITVALDQLVGDGLADVGFINAAGIDLKQAVVEGDLISINVGDANVHTPAIGLLQASQLGSHDWQAAGLSDWVSHVKGRISTLQIGNWTNAGIHVSDTGTIDFEQLPSPNAKFGSIGKALIGSITGGDGLEYGCLRTTGSIGKLVVQGSLTGGNQYDSGTIYCNRRIGSLSIGGSIIGASGSYSGTITAGSIGHLSVGGDLHYDAVGPGGYISTTKLGSATFGGNVSGDITAVWAGTIKIGGEFSGYIDIDATLSKFVAGSISWGVINAGGPLHGGVAIGQVVVHGSVEHAKILAGYVYDRATEANVRIGLISIDGDLVGTDIVAGIDYDSNSYDVILPDPKPTFLSSIGTIRVGGHVEGSDAQNWILAEQIGSFIVAGDKLPLNGRANLELGTTGNYRLVEVRR